MAEEMATWRSSVQRSTADECSLTSASASSSNRSRSRSAAASAAASNRCRRKFARSQQQGITYLRRNPQQALRGILIHKYALPSPVAPAPPPPPPPAAAVP